MLTVSPMTVKDLVVSDPTVPMRVSPVARAMRTWNFGRLRRRPVILEISLAISAKAERISRVARQAWWACLSPSEKGLAQKAMTPSPMNLSTIP